MAERNLITFDYGASSGRAILGEFNGKKLSIAEMHRFTNDPVSFGGHLHWDILRLFHEMKQGLVKTAIAGHKSIDSVGVDTWGVDFGLLDKFGMLLGNPFHYRDTLADGEMEQLDNILPRRAFYERAGLQFMCFNTVYQLSALKHKYPELLERAKDLLLMPDLFNYFLTGEKTAEFSIASTTQLYNQAQEGWDEQLLSRLEIDASIMQEIIPSGTPIGKILPSIAEETGISSSVTSVCGHDTGSAFLAVPMTNGEKCACLSCGTWSLLGVELPKPIITDAAYNVNYTNEGGFANTTRFLKNIMGLWIYGEVKREFERKEGAIDYKTLDAEIAAAPAFASFIDPDSGEFMAPGHMTERVREFCRRTGQPVPETRGEVLRCVHQSLALKYRNAIEALEGVLGYGLDTLRVVGGGCKDTLLMRFTADAINRPVLAGPVEATAIGNMGAQLFALGEAKDRWEIRRIVTESFGVEEYLPTNAPAWSDAYEKFKKILDV